MTIEIGIGGRCLQIDGTVTRKQLIESGVKPAAADEILRFRHRLRADFAARTHDGECDRARPVRLSGGAA